MRVYEFAKTHGVSNRDILKLLKDKGIELSSHMALIPEDGLKYLEIFIKKEKKEDIKEKEIVKKEIVKDVIKEQEAVREVENLILEPALDDVALEEALKKFDDSGDYGVAKPRRFKRKSFVPKTKDLKTEQKIEDKVLSSNKYLSSREVAVPKVITEVVVEKSLPLFEVAILLGKGTNDLIVSLLKKGMICNRNQIISTDVIKGLAESFGIKIITKTKNEEALPAELSQHIKSKNVGIQRAPIVVVMGHVDHGKTTLLDFIRNKNTAAKEKGGITQHLGAYEVSTSHGKIVFLDTPGHEAFSYIRNKGANITDLIVLVVAADDGVKPQTIEVINLIKNFKIPVVIAINKVDKIPSPSYLQTVKRQLAENGLVVEDWGGEVVAVPISAKTGQGVDDLLEMIVLQSQLMDLKANPDLPAKAIILESKLEKGYGPVAVAICTQGTLKRGDFFVCGNNTGKVKLLINSFGEKVLQAGPAVPIKIVGFDKFVDMGDNLSVVSQSEYLKIKSGKIEIPNVLKMAGQQSNLDASKEKIKAINLIIKTDTKGSKEAIDNCLDKISKKFKKGYPQINVISFGIGDIIESDIDLAINTKSLILGLHIKAEKNAFDLAELKDVEIELFDIIYKLVEHIEALLEKNKEVKYNWVKVGQGFVKKVFDIKKIGIVAGCHVKEGVFSKGNKVVCMRNNQQVGEGKINSLQKDTKSVKEVHAGYDCGFVCDAFSGWQEDDIVIVYNQVVDNSSSDKNS